jgi:hypothetical protein
LIEANLPIHIVGMELHLIRLPEDKILVPVICSEDAGVVELTAVCTLQWLISVDDPDRYD